MKYTTAKTDAGNIDLMIAKHGYQWHLNVLETVEADEKATLEEMLSDVPKEMLPQEARTDIVKFVKFQAKEDSRVALGAAEMDQQVKYFRALSQNNLDFLCPKLSNK